MDMTLWTQALLIGLVVWATNEMNDCVYGLSLFSNPIVVCPLVGLVMGDFQQGLIIGAAVAILFVGSFGVGNSIPPNENLAAALSTGFAIKSGYGIDVALTMAMPIAILGALVYSAVCVVMSIPNRMLDSAAEKGDTRKISVIYLVTGFLKYVPLGVVATLAYGFGAEAVENVLASIPNFVQNGLTAASGLMPAIGIGLLLKMICKGYLIPYFFLGYVIAAYLGVPVLGIVILGAILVYIKLDFRGMKTAVNLTNSGQEEIEDDDF